MCDHIAKTLLKRPIVGMVIEICLDCLAHRAHTASGPTEWDSVDLAKQLSEVIHEYNGRAIIGKTQTPR